MAEEQINKIKAEDSAEQEDALLPDEAGEARSGKHEDDRKVVGEEKWKSASREENMKRNEGGETSSVTNKEDNKKSA